MEFPTARRKSSNRSVAMLFITGTIFCAVLAIAGWFGYDYWKNHPNDNHIDPGFEGKPLFYQGIKMDASAKGEKEALKLPFSVVKELVDPSLLYEAQSESIIITTKNKVVRLRTDQLTGLVNQNSFSLHFPVEKVDETIYMPIIPLKQYYGIQLLESEQTGAVMFFKEGDVIQWGKVLKEDPDHPERSVPLRLDSTIKAPILADVKPDEMIMIWGETNGWYKVQLSNGIAGYMDKAKVSLDHTETIPSQRNEEAFVPWKPLGGKINLTWEHVFKNYKTDVSTIGDMPGLNVVSPTWFHLMDGEGTIENWADPSYVKWAHDRGYQIWALFSNNFKPEWTTEALSTHDNRLKMIKQLLTYAEMYDLQGINIDFENVYLEDKDNLTQFVRELTPLLHEQGLVVSMDVTIRDGSDMWSRFYDRREIGKVVDYMMVMTYDEHWASSPKAGSVASLPWAEKGIVDIMEKDQVPASKLLLGVPYYTRIWTEKTEDGKKSVSSKAVYMETVQNIIKDKKLKPVFLENEKQHYVEYEEGDGTKKIWIEDETSMRARIELVKKHSLAGAASWRRGFEQPPIWNLIKETLEKKP